LRRTAGTVIQWVCPREWHLQARVFSNARCRSPFQNMWVHGGGQRKFGLQVNVFCCILCCMLIHLLMLIYLLLYSISTLSGAWWSTSENASSTSIEHDRLQSNSDAENSPRVCTLK
jgi:hypothetical protein